VPPVPPKIGKVLGEAIFKFLRTLQFGMRHDDVKELQKMLIAGKFMKGEPTGYFGSATLGAVKAYQKSHKLPCTGLVGPMTRDILNRK
jgi:peptidoglycan hydrolase-like protein with peptidoglycan-binding domain